MNARKLAAPIGLLTLFLVALFSPVSAQAAFGIQPGSFKVTTTNEDGTTDFQAGSRPFEYTISFKVNVDNHGDPEGTVRDLIVDLPPGVLGNQRALPACPTALFEGLAPFCPGDTQIGIVHAKAELLNVTFPVYNMVAPHGVAGRVGFSLFGNNSFQEATVRSGSDYGLRISDPTIPDVNLVSISQTLWGVPADPGHDAERQCIAPNGIYIYGCASSAKPTAFLSLPTSCGEPLLTTISIDALENPGVWDTQSVFSTDEEGNSAGIDGCNALEFEPSITAQPTTTLADTPTGLDFNLHQPQNQDPDGFSTAHLKDTTVTLPQGLTLNAGAANGLDVCSTAQMGLIGTGFAPPNPIHFSEAPQSCPNAAKLGTVEVKTPLLKDKLPGAVYLAKPYANPFGSFLAIYLAVEDDLTGTTAKLAGKVSADPVTGQLTAIFTENPQLPLEDVALHFFAGPKASLKTPIACGKYTTTSTLVPWSTPEGQTKHPTDSFVTSVGAGGGACPSSEAGAPNKPSFTAGTIAPQAGAYSPFVLKLVRADGTQRLKQIDTTLPKGLTGKLAGIPYCPEAAIAQAISREAPNKGALEQQSPSCPAASEVGTLTVGAGAGLTPYYATGHAYLAGPYKGAPLSFAFITPAVAGPFDLGAVVARAAAYVDPETAKIHVVSDPLPSIIQGVPLDIRSIAVNMGRPSFTLNPTSCDPMQVLGSATSTLGSLASLESPFQVGGCKALKFAPKLALRLKGPTKRGRFPALKAVLTYPKGGAYANIASAQVTLPHAEFIEQAHFKTICTRVQFVADQCPKGSIYGYARAYTPLLDQPVKGPVYLRSSNHELPDLVAALRGQVDVDLVGRVDTGKGGGIRNTFEAAPDAPVSKFVLEMQGGKKGLLVNSENICRKAQRAIADFSAQNGKAFEATPLVRNDCKAKKARKGKAKKGH